LPGRSPAEAVANFLEPLQRAASCVTRTPFIISAGGRHTVGKVHSLTWPNFEPVPVQGPKGEIVTLDLAIQYEILHIPRDRVRGPYKVATRGYMHTVQTIDGAEVIAFHWHPDGNSDVRDTHMHVGSTQLNPGGVLTKKHHIPAPRMSVEGVLRFCIDQLGVEPLREDWSMVLADSEDLFHMWATWGGERAPDERST